MKESTTYQAILAEGEAKGEARGEAKGALIEARRILVRLGTKRFGEPEAPIRDAVEAIDSVEKLEQLTDRLLDISNWEELLALSPRPRRNGGRKKKS